MTPKKREFLAKFIADLSMLLIASGVLKQIFEKTFNLKEIFIVSVIAVIMFMIALTIYPKE